MKLIQKRVMSFLIIPLMILTQSSGCDEDCTDAIGNLAMQSLELVSTPGVGKILEVKCVFSASIDAYSTCIEGDTQTPETELEVEWGYSSTPSQDISDYTIESRKEYLVEAKPDGAVQTDYMDYLPTKPGYYMCKVDLNPNKDSFEGEFDDNVMAKGFEVK